jgi:hypothetical protein
MRALADRLGFRRRSAHDGCIRVVPDLRENTAPFGANAKGPST